MHKEIKKAIMYYKTVELIYMASDGTITKRRVKPYKIENHYFRAYCFLRESRRTFAMNRVLACAQTINRAKLVM